MTEQPTSPRWIRSGSFVLAITLVTLTPVRVAGERMPEPGRFLYGAVRNVQGMQNTRLIAGALKWTFMTNDASQSLARHIELSENQPPVLVHDLFTLAP